MRPVTGLALLFLLLPAPAVLLAEEARKALIRRRVQHPAFGTA